MGGANTLRKFIGKTISLWCGEYDVDGSELIVVIKVEDVEDGWLIGTTESEKKYWFDIRQIVYFQEGDCFTADKEHLEVVVAGRTKKEGEVGNE